jgi:hypothetical protein
MNQPIYLTAQEKQYAAHILRSVPDQLARTIANKIDGRRKSTGGSCRNCDAGTPHKDCK